MPEKLDNVGHSDFALQFPNPPGTLLSFSEAVVPVTHVERESGWDPSHQAPGPSPALPPHPGSSQDFMAGVSVCKALLRPLGVVHTIFLLVLGPLGPLGPFGDFHGGMGFFSLLQHPNWETGYMHLSMGF